MTSVLTLLFKDKLLLICNATSLKYPLIQKNWLKLFLDGQEKRLPYCTKRRMQTVRYCISLFQEWWYIHRAILALQSIKYLSTFPNASSCIWYIIYLWYICKTSQNRKGWWLNKIILFLVDFSVGLLIITCIYCKQSKIRKTLMYLLYF